MASEAVISPLGNVLTLADLPSPDTRRWVRRRKGELLAAIESGLLSPEKARSIYGLSTDEFLAWKDAVAQYGPAGLRARRPRESKRKDAEVTLQQFFASEIERLITLAHVRGAAPIAALLEQVAAQVNAMQAREPGWQAPS
jgi:hypothetical protein